MGSPHHGEENFWSFNFFCQSGSEIYGLFQLILKRHKPLEYGCPIYVNYLIFSVLFVIRKILLAKSLIGVINFCLVSDILSGFECERLRIGTFSGTSLIWFCSIFWTFVYSGTKKYICLEVSEYPEISYDLEMVIIKMSKHQEALAMY